jgi:hypothetical protein
MNYLKGNFGSPEVVNNVKIKGLRRCRPSCPYIEFGARACTKKKVLQTVGS